MQKPTDIKSARFATLLSELDSIDDSKILVILGEEEIVSRLAIGSESKDELESIGKNWIKNNLSRFREAICTNENIQKLMNKETKLEKIQLKIAVAEVLSTMLTGLPLACVSHLLVKQGLEKLCENT